jgi:hypothetical protein
MAAMRLPVMLALVVLCALMLAAVAAASGGDVIEDCTQHGTLTKRYSQMDYRQALADLPADVDEYGDCRTIIQEAQLADAAGGDSNGTGAGGLPASFNQPPGGPTGGAPTTTSSAGRSGAGTQGADPTAINPTTPDENAALVDATRNGGGPVHLGKEAIQPGAQNSSFTENLPTPLLAVLALLGTAALAAGALALKRKLATSDQRLAAKRPTPNA